MLSFNKVLLLKAISAMFVNWAPSLEKSRLIGFSTSGSSIGDIVALPLGSYLCLNGFDNGWPSIFYIFSNLVNLICFDYNLYKLLCKLKASSA